MFKTIMFLLSAVRSCRGFVARPTLAQQIARPVRLQAPTFATLEMCVAGSYFNSSDGGEGGWDVFFGTRRGRWRGALTRLRDVGLMRRGRVR